MDSPESEVERKLTPVADEARAGSSIYSIHKLMDMATRRRWFLLSTIGGLLLLCGLYCIVAPNQYEASSTVALRIQPVSALSIDGAETVAPASILSTPMQLETLVNVLRSEQLEWRVITELKLYEKPAFSRNFGQRFSGFRAAAASPEAQEYLLSTFGKRLHVRTLPRTLLVEISYRSKDPAMSAAVVNTLVRSYMELESKAHVDATDKASGWLEGQLTILTAQVKRNETHLAEFERQHEFMSAEQAVPGGASVESLHESATLQVDEVGRLLATASGDRILREALYREAQLGNPEQVLAANPEVQAEMGASGATMAQQLRMRASELDVELAQLRVEHGPKFPRVVELERAMQDIDGQLKEQDANLLEAFRRTWKTAQNREQLLQGQLDARTADGIRQNSAMIEYAALHEQVVAGRELCSRLQRRIDEAGLSAGVRASSIVVVDYARQPFKSVAPNAALYLAITFVTGLWLAMGGALLLDGLDALRQTRVRRLAALLVALAMSGLSGYGQAPTPNTSGLPSGVVRLPKDEPLSRAPDPKQAPAVWNAVAPSGTALETDTVPRPGGVAMVLPIGAGDFLDVSEFHTPEFHTSVRVAADGTVLLPLVGAVKVLGLGERQASAVIEKAFVDEGMLLHPQVSVMVTSAVGQDVSVLGEVARPGVYAYTVHHRLLDLISAASGLSTNAGRLVSVYHRDDPHTAHAIVLDPSGVDSKMEHNPELAPGDTLQVSRAGLAYVIGDVVRPGGFAVDPVQGLTIVQALSLAWGATPNAAATKAILIRDQAGGRTLTTLNLRRMIRGQDPDQAVRDRDILFVPDSVAKNLMNKSLESAIQSAIGVSIYAGLVYSQRF
ncbi:polysaccharide biosynthesis/export family protein [Acidicapsa ligni]|uniref:polysaccharide biosynthesis/export family protein n=1 Tax=Acidicapsa ligni TaxID=542300 RepID=UPI0021DF8599|nr:polysaccharide biosynthesis/export family protein [Acidicapsa ligni]